MSPFSKKGETYISLFWNPKITSVFIWCHLRIFTTIERKRCGLLIKGKYVSDPLLLYYSLWYPLFFRHKWSSTLVIVSYPECSSLLEQGYLRHKQWKHKFLVVYVFTSSLAIVPCFLPNTCDIIWRV